MDWRAGREWARDVRPIVAELEAAAEQMPSRGLVELLERAIGHVVKVLQTRADDSSGTIGDQDFFEADPVRYASALGDRGPCRRAAGGR